MERGDLSAWAVQRMVIVLEGVLVDFDEQVAKGRFGRTKTVARNMVWLDLPLKQAANIKRRYPDIALDIVTFLGEDVAELAAGFFDRNGIDFNEVYAADFDEWCWALSFKPEITTIYDSEMERLMRYGQKGVAVTKGRPF
jgi:hypothetical protein